MHNNKRCLMNKSELIKQALQNGDNVQLLGFGTFEVRERAAREGRHPHTARI
ncbi:HU family DNA-binding protein, partial [Bacillus thuringiensis]|uniref:HU family DNA-binding protein n=1 Tax=Bacillus thuringiensis TaxID=1428 RepID=UPI003C6CA35F